MTTDRELTFHGAMVDLYLRAKREANCNATYFLQMISDAELRGYRTARQLIHWGRLDPTVDVVILRPDWADLFTDEERAIARRRLTDYGFDVDRFLASVGSDGGRS